MALLWQDRVMKFLIHLIAESKVSQHVQEIACLERKEHRLEEAPGAHSLARGMTLKPLK
jgi:hypothetical protein